MAMADVSMAAQATPAPHKQQDDHSNRQPEYEKDVRGVQRPELKPLTDVPSMRRSDMHTAMKTVLVGSWATPPNSAVPAHA